MKLSFKHICAFIIILFTSCEYEKIPNAPDSGYISGKIYDALTGATIPTYESLSGAEVWTEPETISTLSLEDGRFFLNNVDPGKYLLIADKYGFYLNRAPVEVFSRKKSSQSIVLFREIEGNTPPEKPYRPLPQDSLTKSDTAFTLYWKCSDEDTNQTMIFYDIYFSKYYPPAELLAWDIADVTSFFVSGLERNTRYYWRVVAKDWDRATSISDIWTFYIQ